MSDEIPTPIATRQSKQYPSAPLGLLFAIQDLERENAALTAKLSLMDSAHEYQKGLVRSREIEIGVLTAKLTAMEDRIKVRGEMRDEAIEQMNLAEQKLAATERALEEAKRDSARLETLVDDMLSPFAINEGQRIQITDERVEAWRAKRAARI